MAPMPNRRPRRAGPFAAAATYAALAAVDTALAGASTDAARRARYVTKPLLMPALAAGFRRATRSRSDALTRGTAAAQALSWGGDVALLRSGERAFLAGVGAFLAAHVCYVAGFTSVRAPREHLDLGGVRAAGALWLATAPAMTWAAGRRSPGMAGPVGAYATMLVTMFASSTTLDPALPRSARTAIRAGSTLFLLSDTLLGAQDFLLTAKRPSLERAVMATYTAGQGLMAWGVARAR